MKDRISKNILPNGAIRYGIYDSEGSLVRYEYIKKEDEPIEVGTPINKATLLSDSTAQLLELTEQNAIPNNALARLNERIYEKPSSITAMSTTASSQPNKIATIEGNAGKYFKLVIGAEVSVHFNNPNTVTNQTVTLNVNNTGAFFISFLSIGIFSQTNPISIANKRYLFRFTGVAWAVINPYVIERPIRVFRQRINTISTISQQVLNFHNRIGFGRYVNNVDMSPDSHPSRLVVPPPFTLVQLYAGGDYVATMGNITLTALRNGSSFGVTGSRMFFLNNGGGAGTQATVPYASIGPIRCQGGDYFELEARLQNVAGYIEGERFFFGMEILE